MRTSMVNGERSEPGAEAVRAFWVSHRLYFPQNRTRTPPRGSGQGEVTGERGAAAVAVTPERRPGGRPSLHDAIFHKIYYSIVLVSYFYHGRQARRPQSAIAGLETRWAPSPVCDFGFISGGPRGVVRQARGYSPSESGTARIADHDQPPSGVPGDGVDRELGWNSLRLRPTET